MLKVVTRRVLALAAVASLGGFALGVRVSAISLPDAADRPNLIGAWQLNPDKSDDPQKKLKGGRTGTWTTPRAGTGGVTGGMPGAHGGFGGVVGRPYEQDNPALREAMKAVAEAPEKLTIVYRDADVVLTSGEGVVQTLRPNGDTVKESTAGGHDAERTTKWDGANLVTEVKMSGGVKLTQTYTRPSDSRELVVTSRLEGPGRVVDIRRVYDAVADGVPKINN